MNPWGAKIRIDQQYVASMLPDQCIGQIRGNKSLSFCRDRAGNQNGLQWLVLAHPVKTRAQRPELLCPWEEWIRIFEDNQIWIGLPIPPRALSPQGVELQWAKDRFGL